MLDDLLEQQSFLKVINNLTLKLTKYLIVQMGNFIIINIMGNKLIII